MECSNCGISENKVRLLDVISDKGIVKLCKKCSEELNFPVVKKPTNFGSDFYKKEPTQSVYERLSRMSQHNKNNDEKNKEKTIQKTPETELTHEQRQKDFELKKIVEENIYNTEKGESRKDLIDNFHWIITRARRKRKLTREQFAREINESEPIIKLAEQGFIHEKNPELVNKIENYFGIRLKKKESGFPYTDVQKNNIQSSVEKEPIPGKEVSFLKNSEEGINFDDISSENLTISDLKKLKQQKKQKPDKETQNFKPANKEKKPEENKTEKDSEEKELTDKEIDDILYGGK